MSLEVKIIPDFSSRGPAIPPPDMSGRTPPPMPTPKRIVPFEYNTPPTIPEYKPVYISTIRDVPKTIETFQTIPQPIPHSQFSPSIETYPTANNSYFLTELDVGNAVREWAGYPAIANVNMEGHSLLSTLNGTFTGDVTCLSVLTSSINATGGIVTPQETLRNVGTIPGRLEMFDNNGAPHILESINGDLYFDNELLAKAGDIQNVADWSLYPAISTIDMVGNPIIGASGVTITDGSHPQLLTATAGGLDVNGNAVVTGTYVKSLNADTGDVVLSSINGSVTITKPVDGVIDFAVPVGAGGVASINGQTGPITFESLDSSIAITNPTPGVINLATTGGNIADWANYPAVAPVNCSTLGINCQPTSLGYSYSQLDTNLTIGKPSYVFFPDVAIYPRNFNVGGLTAPATSISFTSLVDIGITGGAGVSVTGGGGLSLVGGGGITALGATITLGAGALSMLGGSINLGAGTINMAGGLINALGTAVNVGGGLITATTGGLLVTAGSVVVGTSANAGAGIVCYGGTIQCVPSIVGGAGGLDMTNQCPITGVTSITGNNITIETPVGGSITIGDVNHSYIEVDNAGSLLFRLPNSGTPHGSIEINNVTGKIEIITQGEDIVVSNSITELVVGTSTDTPPVTGLFFDDTRLLFNNAPIGGSSGVASLNTQTGAVGLTSANTGTLAVGSTGAGNVQLSVPVGAGGVASLNSLTGGLSIVAGSGISVTPSGSSITIDNTSPGGSISVPTTSVLFSTDGTTITGDSNMTFDVPGQRLTTNNITALYDLTIDSAASLNVGGSTGSAGKVVAITTGDYPVWSFPPPPSVISITLNGTDTITEVPELGRYYPVDTDVGGTNYTIVFDVSAVPGGTSWYIKNVTAIPVNISYDAGGGASDAIFFGGAIALTPEQGYSVCAWDGATLTIY